MQIDHAYRRQVRLGGRSNLGSLVWRAFLGRSLQGHCFKKPLVAFVFSTSCCADTRRSTASGRLRDYSGTKLYSLLDTLRRLA